MIERRRGAIINVVSIAGHNGGGPGAGIYASSKAALTSFTKALAKELAPQGIRVNAVSPGVIDTPFHEVFSTPEMIQNFVKMIPLGRVGTASRVRECHRLPRVGCRELRGWRDDRGQWGAVDEVGGGSRSEAVGC